MAAKETSYAKACMAAAFAPQLAMRERERESKKHKEPSRCSGHGRYHTYLALLPRSLVADYADIGASPCLGISAGA